jgi:hypothetical protein
VRALANRRLWQLLLLKPLSHVCTRPAWRDAITFNARTPRYPVIYQNDLLGSLLDSQRVGKSPRCTDYGLSAHFPLTSTPWDALDTRVAWFATVVGPADAQVDIVPGTNCGAEARSQLL